jgi:hypothetical protein
MIDNIDKNTIPHIMFVSIHLDSITVNDDLEQSIANAPLAPTVNIDFLTSGDVITLDTNFSFVRFDTDVNIINQTENEVQFIVPYDVSVLTITTKDVEGELVVMAYEVA